MAPKKKSGKGGKSSRGSGGIIDGVSMSEMSREQLEQFTVRMRQELEREREERNYFQLERDKLTTFWHITRQQHQELKAELRNKDRALEEAEEKHQAELKVSKEKVKHLMYENQTKLTNMKAEGVVALKLAEEDYNQQAGMLWNDKNALKSQIVEDQVSFHALTKELYLEHSEEKDKLRNEFSCKIRQMDAKEEDRVTKLSEHFILTNQMEVSQIEESKNKHINDLIDKHKNAFSELQNFYKQIIANNTTEINELKNELSDIKERNTKLEESVKRLSLENKKLTRPLAEATNRLQEMEKQMAHYNRDKSTLLRLRRRLAIVDKELTIVTRDRNIFEGNSVKLEDELRELKKDYTSALSDIEEKSALQVTLLEKKLSTLEKESEEREMQLAHLVSKANLDPKAVVAANMKIERDRRASEKALDDLRLELGYAVKAHDDFLELVTMNSVQLGVPAEYLDGFQYLYPRLRDLFLGRNPPSESSEDQGKASGAEGLAA